MTRGPRCNVAGMHAIVRGQEGGHFSHDCLAFLSTQSFKLCHPDASLAKVWKFWGLSPSPSGVCRRATSSQQMHVDFPIGCGPSSGLEAQRGRGGPSCPHQNN